MNRNVCTSLMIAGILTLANAPGLYAQSTETDQLKATVKSLDQAVQELKLKVADLEKTNNLVPAEQQPVGHVSPVIYRRTFIDNQEAAPRPDDRRSTRNTGDSSPSPTPRR